MPQINILTPIPKIKDSSELILGSPLSDLAENIKRKTDFGLNYVLSKNIYEFNNSYCKKAL